MEGNFQIHVHIDHVHYVYVVCVYKVAHCQFMICSILLSATLPNFFAILFYKMSKSKQSEYTSCG